MPITEKQRLARRSRLGSSDIPAILGLSPWRNAYDVWLDKTGQLPEQGPNAAMQTGTRFEAGVLEFAESNLGRILRNQYRSAPDLPLGAHIDAIVAETNEPVEAKTSGLFAPLERGWGDEGTDEVPSYVLVQAMAHIMCMMPVVVPVCHVAAFLGGRGFRMYRVDRNDELIETIAEEARRFWADHVEARVPPADVIPDLNVVKRVRREPEKIVPVDAQLWNAYQNCKMNLRHWQDKADKAQAELLAALGDAEAGELGPGAGMVTYYEQMTRGYTVEPKTYRVLRHRKAANA